MVLTYDIRDVEPYINWIYFDFAWGVSGKHSDEKEKLRRDADNMLRLWQYKYHVRAMFDIFKSNSDGDDLLIGNETRLPLLRQQHDTANGHPNLCLSDFVHPLSSGLSDKVGVFAATVDSAMEREGGDDAYLRMLAQTLADRLAEATAEKMHEEVRKIYWGYAPDEHLSISELHKEAYQGIRPAIGYPSLPDTSVNFVIDKLIDFGKIGIRLTPSGMMTPHASVSGLMFAHPKARYFNIGKIGEDQLVDYAHRRGLPVELMRKYLAALLI